MCYTWQLKRIFLHRFSKIGNNNSINDSGGVLQICLRGIFFSEEGGGGGGESGSSVGRVGQDGVGSIHVSARPLLVGSVSV